MDNKYYERKINDVIMKCPIEAGVEILVYNVLDCVLNPHKMAIVDINRLQRHKDDDLAGDWVADIAVLSTDFQYNIKNQGKVYGLIEVKATNKVLAIKKQIIEQRKTTNNYIYTNGLCWQYFQNSSPEPKWEKVLAKDAFNHEIKCRTQAQAVFIDKAKFEELLKELSSIKWIE